VLTTAETFIRLGRSTATASTTAGDFVNIVDTVAVDVRGEATNGTITPDRTGRYLIAAEVELDGGTTDGDTGGIQVFNTDASSTAALNTSRFALREARANPVTLVRKLEAGESYEVQVTNFTNSFEAGPLSAVVVSRLLTR